ncbi:hypothetical protein Misp01_38900 [Microtetraspora sp. NBRC 13810]|nr:hypothetical protein Misp01_38900 [Microtetraspora sp. NBRC 13810]
MLRERAVSGPRRGRPRDSKVVRAAAKDDLGRTGEPVAVACRTPVTPPPRQPLPATAVQTTAVQTTAEPEYPSTALHCGELRTVVRHPVLGTIDDLARGPGRL